MRLSFQQQDALESIRDAEALSRDDFYNRGIRMTTVRSLVRKGLVKCSPISCEHTGMTKIGYFLAVEEKASSK